MKRSGNRAPAGASKGSVVLVLAYGNPVREDDGVACRAADALRGKYPESQVEIRSLHQLTPELAEAVSRFACVIFVDAASQQAGKPGEIRVEEICADIITGNQTAVLGHSLSAGALLALAASLYGARTRAFSVTVRGENFGHGDRLSPAVAAAVPDLIGRVELLVRAALAGDALPGNRDAGTFA